MSADETTGTTLMRIADAAERIAAALEAKPRGALPGSITVTLDGKQLAGAVLRETLKKAARGPSSLVGGSLVTGAGEKA